MADELIDICDEDNKPLGVQKTKGEAHEKGLWHRACHIWIFNSRGEMLLQLRAKEKRLFPDMWDAAVGGHIAAGEEALTTAVREAEEELGLVIAAEDLEFFKIFKKEITRGEIKNKEFYYDYIFRYDGPSDDLRLQKEEVQAVKFVPIQKLEDDLIAEPEKYVPHGDYWFEVIKEIKRKI